MLFDVFLKQDESLTLWYPNIHIIIHLMSDVMLYLEINYSINERHIFKMLLKIIVGIEYIFYKNLLK